MDNVKRTITKTGLNQGIKYKITFWAKNLGSNNYTLRVNKNDEVVTGSSNFLNSIVPALVFTNSATGWSLYECYVTGATKIDINNQSVADPNAAVPMMGNQDFTAFTHSYVRKKESSV